MTATAFIDDPILAPNTPGRWDTSGVPAADRSVDPATGRPQLQLIAGAAQAQIPAVVVDPMVEVHRRRRFLVALALTAIILATAQLLGVSITSFGPTSSPVDESAPVVHVVRPGDTYPSIAASLGSDNPVAFADELAAANGNAQLIAGQRLIVQLDDLD